MGIDLNSMEEEEEEEAAAPAVLLQPPTVCLELWHACAGPLISLPKKGSVVVYLPQGHLEHLGESTAAAYRHDLPPPQVFCRVVDVKLHADVNTDEVYARLSLVAESEEVERRLHEGGMEGEEEVEVEGEKSSVMPHMFCKTLTASDTSTHGGFSVPRRAAEDCFPPLDYVQQRPSQELVAKDLHGVEWRFRHIYRGQPRRHLLTTGWSAFVNKKKLVSGDAVLFLRGNDGELRLGIRRAVQLKNGTPAGALYSHGSNHGVLEAISGAISAKREFQIYYNPRSSSSDYIIPFGKFSKSLGNPLSIGMRFKMRYESEDSAERRCTGMVTGIGDVEPMRWPGSKWRCLLVRWDDVINSNRQNRLSPWDIELIGNASGSHGLSVPSSKRTKMCLHPANANFPAPHGAARPDLVESARYHKVLQGQEFTGSHALEGITIPSSQPSTRFRNHNPHPNPNPNITYPPCMGFVESLRFQKVLQGQEIYPAAYPMRPFHSAYPTPTRGYPLLVQPQASSPSSVLMFQPNLCNSSGEGSNESAETGNMLSAGNSAKVRPENDCRLFGFSLKERIPARNDVGKGDGCATGSALYALCATPL
ncbi:auxin response factor 15-like isoform X3 [Carex littledalei]|uniref:Auxin response factor n=1 Tax=Carex littledalei TaxID=544730 RepID=A0A833RRW6_9POAL|nr:auxin response factor 15-like isoform X3 [Carex littledalei]